MITERLYKDCVKALQDYNEYVDKVYKNTNGAVSLFEIDEIEELELCLQRLLEYCTDDVVEDRFDMSDLDYFIYEQDFGKKGDKYFVTDIDGTEHPIHNINELWDYIVKTRPNIEDKKGKENLDRVDENSTEDWLELLERLISKLKE